MDLAADSFILLVFNISEVKSALKINRGPERAARRKSLHMFAAQICRNSFNSLRAIFFFFLETERTVGRIEKGIPTHEMIDGGTQTAVRSVFQVNKVQLASPPLSLARARSLALSHGRI